MSVFDDLIQSLANSGEFFEDIIYVGSLDMRRVIRLDEIESILDVDLVDEDGSVITPEEDNDLRYPCVCTDLCAVTENRIYFRWFYGEAQGWSFNSHQINPTLAAVYERDNVVPFRYVTTVMTGEKRFYENNDDYINLVDVN